MGRPTADSGTTRGDIGVVHGCYQEMGQNACTIPVLEKLKQATRCLFTTAGNSSYLNATLRMIIPGRTGLVWIFVTAYPMGFPRTFTWISYISGCICHINIQSSSRSEILAAKFVYLGGIQRYLIQRLQLVMMLWYIDFNAFEHLIMPWSYLKVLQHKTKNARKRNYLNTKTTKRCNSYLFQVDSPRIFHSDEFSDLSNKPSLIELVALLMRTKKNESSVQANKQINQTR